MLLSLPFCLEIDENLNELKPKEMYVVHISLIFEKNNYVFYAEPLHIDSNICLLYSCQMIVCITNKAIELEYNIMS